MLTKQDIETQMRFKLMRPAKGNNGCGKPCEHGGECTYHLPHEGKVYHLALGVGSTLSQSIRCVIGEVER